MSVKAEVVKSEFQSCTRQMQYETPSKLTYFNL